MAGVDPRCHMTYRELVIYARERMDEAWWHTASLAAGVQGLFSKKEVDMKQFHPFHMTLQKKKQATAFPVKEFNQSVREGNWRF